MLENKVLSQGIIGISAPILAEITIRKSQHLFRTSPKVAITMDYRYPGRAGVLLARENDGFLRQRPALTPHDVRISWRRARPWVT
jgi:hypothetical protein